MEAEAAATQRRMDSANALLSALAGEEGRWTQQSQAFDSTIQRLTGRLQDHRTIFICETYVQLLDCASKMQEASILNIDSLSSIIYERKGMR